MKTLAFRIPKQTYTLRSVFFYVTLVTAVFWLGWSCHKVVNDRAVAARDQALRMSGEAQLISAQLKDLSQTLERMPGVSKVAVKQARLIRSSPLDSQLVIAVWPENSVLDQVLSDKIKSICATRFARVPSEAIYIIDSKSAENFAATP
jgi:hypothetical protein